MTEREDGVRGDRGLKNRTIRTFLASFPSFKETEHAPSEDYSAFTSASLTVYDATAIYHPPGKLPLTPVPSYPIRRRF